MDRRTALRTLALGAAGAFAGCSLGSDGEDTDTATGERSGTPTLTRTSPPRAALTSTDSRTPSTPESQTASEQATEAGPPTTTAQPGTQVARLLAPDADGGDSFGAPMALAGDTVVVGAAGDEDDGALRGSAFAFRRGADDWSLDGRLVPDAPDASVESGFEFGTDVAISGDVALVGSREVVGPDEPPGTGLVAVFERRGGEWGRTALLTSDAGGDWFGASVAVAGDTALVGAPDHDTAAGDGGGAVFAFTRSDGDWRRRATLAPTPGESGHPDDFGRSVTMDGGTAVVADPSHEDAEGDQVGAAYVFARRGGEWVREARLTPERRGVEFDLSGQSVAIDGDAVLVNLDGDGTADSDAVGGVQVFARTDGDWTRGGRLSLDGSDDLRGAGHSLALDGDRALVAASRTENRYGGDSDTGVVYLYAREGDRWRRRATLLPDDGRPVGGFGDSLALADGQALVGARETHLLTPNWEGSAGAVYVFAV